jgi:hypothetical protein
MNGYKRLHALDILARAETIETVAGYTREDVERELHFALRMTDENDRDSLVWLACLIERRIVDIS